MESITSENLNSIVNPYKILSKKSNIIGYSYTTLTGVHNKWSFKVTLKVNKKRYVAIGPSIIAAKNMASLAALKEMYINGGESPTKMSKEKKSPSSKDDREKSREIFVNKSNTVLNPFSKKKNINKKLDQASDSNPLVGSNLTLSRDDEEVPQPPKLWPNIEKRKSKDILINPVRKKLKLSSAELKKDINLSREETIDHCLSILLNGDDDDSMSCDSDDVAIIENPPPEVIEIEEISPKSDEVVAEIPPIQNSKNTNTNNKGLKKTVRFDDKEKMNTKKNEGLNHPSRKTKSSAPTAITEIKNSAPKMLPKIKSKSGNKSRPHALNRQKNLKKWAMQQKNNKSNKNSNKCNNPIKNLEALCPGVIYEPESEIGQSHASFFLQSATLNGRNFIGHGKTKNLARVDVAKQILDTLDENSYKYGKPNQGNMQQSAIVRSKMTNRNKRTDHMAQQTNCNYNNSNFAGQSFQEYSIQKLLNNFENPRNLIINFRQNYVNNVSNFSNHYQDPFEFGNPNSRCAFRFGFPTFNQNLYLPQCHADVLEQLVLQRFEQLIVNRSEAYNYKVLAGIVMTRNMDFKNGKVIAIATGTKCINGGNICSDGSVVNDSHAEVIARRCLLKFFYTQLKIHCNPSHAMHSIFVRNPSGLQYQFTLDSNIQFHLYISTAPCGDARVFSSSENYSSHDYNYGQLRTKVEGGMGTQRVENQYMYQAWDGIQIGEPLFTMSCSDKIARWNVLGVQGALLATLVEPIYLSSIVLGSMFNTQHLYRAVCGRLVNNLSYLPKPFHLNQPLLGQTSKNRLRRNTEQTPCIGMNWTLGDNEIELISLPTGRQISNIPSQLCKQILFRKFIYLVYNLPNLNTSRMSHIYADVKLIAHDFQLAKKELFSAFQRAQLGCWIKKPQEQNEFSEKIHRF